MKMHYDRRSRQGIMLAYPFEQRRLLKWQFPIIAQPKYNGLRCLAYRMPEGIHLYSSTGLPITTVPHILRELEKWPVGIYDGELYIHNQFQRLTSLVNRGSTAAGHDEVIYVVFDIKSQEKQFDRLVKLESMRFAFQHSGCIDIAPCWLCPDQHQIEHKLADVMEEQYEGLILRQMAAPYVEKRSTTMMKLKPRSSDTYRIVSCLEECSIHNEPKGRLGAFLVEDADGNQFKVGSGFTAAQRSNYWQLRNELPGHIITIKYQALTDRGVPWFPVFINILPQRLEAAAELSEYE